MVHAVRTSALAVLLMVALGCDRGKAIDRELTVACGMCILKTPAQGCYWAADVDGEVLPIVGPGVPTDHEAHSPTGMCSMPRHARIRGTLHEGRIIADEFDLHPPAEGAKAVPHDHEH